MYYPTDTTAGTFGAITDASVAETPPVLLRAPERDGYRYGRRVINIAVREESGRSVAEAESGLEWTAAFEELASAEFPMLWALDPYGDAVFNKRQVSLLLAELDRLPAPCAGDWVSQVRELCRVVERGTHLSLWFIGD